ncbi:MAG: MerC domain-containing protein [Pirellula sp.]
MSRWKDTLGIIASVACAIHCAITPVFLAFLPSLKLTSWMASPQFHQLAAIVCVSLVAVSIWPAFRRFRDYRVLALSSTGLCLILSAAFLLPDHCCSHGLQAGNGIQEDIRPDEVAQSKDMPTAFSLVSVRSDVKENSESDSLSPGERLRQRVAEEHTHSHSASSDFWAWIQPWLTPIGGFFLVVAHALNLVRRDRCSKSCGCKKKGHQHDDLVIESLVQTKAA